MGCGVSTQEGTDLSGYEFHSRRHQRNRSVSTAKPQRILVGVPGTMRTSTKTLVSKTGDATMTWLTSSKGSPSGHTTRRKRRFYRRTGTASTRKDSKPLSDKSTIDATAPTEKHNLRRRNTTQHNNNNNNSPLSARVHIVTPATLLERKSMPSYMHNHTNTKEQEANVHKEKEKEKRTVQGVSVHAQRAIFVPPVMELTDNRIERRDDTYAYSPISHQVFSDHEDEKEQQEEEQQQQQQQQQQQPLQHIRHPRRRGSNGNALEYRGRQRRVSDFELIRNLGRGKSCRVDHVREIEGQSSYPAREYALKTMKFDPNAPDPTTTTATSTQDPKKHDGLASPNQRSLRCSNRLMYLNEVRGLMHCQDHPSFIDLYDYFEDPVTSTGYFLLELCRGDTLFRRLQKEGPIPENNCREIFLQLIEGLVFLHSKGIIHRDIKPENIVFASEDNLDPSVRIIDFGLSRIPPGLSLFSPNASENARSNPANALITSPIMIPIPASLNNVETPKPSGDTAVRRRTRSDRAKSLSESHLEHARALEMMSPSILSENIQVGTFVYSSPELIQGQPYNASVDVWGVGLCLYSMLVAYHPFDPFGVLPQEKIIRNIAKLRYDFDDPAWDGIEDKSVIDLLSRILTTRDRRIALEDIFNHEWVRAGNH